MPRPVLYLPCLPLPWKHLLQDGGDVATLVAQAEAERVGVVVVGWLGRASTALHCTHHVLTCRLKRHHSVFSFPSLPGPVVGEMPSATR